MTDIGEIKAEATYANGKRRLRGSDIKAQELIGKPFVVVDFETDIIPRRERERYNRDVRDNGGNTEGVEPPKSKYLLSVLFDGQPRKLWTGLPDNKAKLDKARELGALPLFATINADYSGKHPCFELASAVEAGLTPPSDEEINTYIKRFNLK